MVQSPYREMAEEELRRSARRYGRLIVSSLVRVLTSPQSTAAARVAAAMRLHDIGYGQSDRNKAAGEIEELVAELEKKAKPGTKARALEQQQNVGSTGRADAGDSGTDDDSAGTVESD